MKKYQAIVISICCILLLIVLYLIITTIGSRIRFVNSNTGEWSSFKKSTVEKYSNDLVDMSKYGINVSLFIDLIMKNNVSIDEVKEIFEATKNYIILERVFENLQSQQLKETGNRFIEIHISFKLKGSNKAIYRFSSYASKSINGNAEYDSFSNWVIKVDGKKSEEYKPAIK